MMSVLYQNLSHANTSLFKIYKRWLVILSQIDFGRVHVLVKKVHLRIYNLCVLLHVVVALNPFSASTLLVTSFRDAHIRVQHISFAFCGKVAQPASLNTESVSSLTNY